MAETIPTIIAGTTAPTPLTQATQVIDLIAELAHRMQEASPGYESLLHQIHTILKKDDNLVHLLSDEQIGIVVSGLAKKKNVVIAVAAVKGGRSKSENNRLKNLSLDDI